MNYLTTTFGLRKLPINPNSDSTHSWTDMEIAGVLKHILSQIRHNNVMRFNNAMYTSNFVSRCLSVAESATATHKDHVTRQQ